MQDKPFVLFCAGEDSGDVLGESLVRYTNSCGLAVRGVGGRRMQLAGLLPAADYETLPVSGFFDVLPRAHRLNKVLQKLKSLLECESCVALVCIDYPGFNMKLAPLAARLKKPVLYVAPPQVWAWKKKRARRLHSAKLAVLFDFERRVYESHGLKADLLEHPFLRASRSLNPAGNSDPADNLNPAGNSDPASSLPPAGNSDSAIPPRVLLLPGSRLSQALRNIPFFKVVASRLLEENPECKFVVAASRSGIRDALESAFKVDGRLPGWLSFEDVPLQAQSRAEFYSRFPVALCIPGSATLELALSGVSPVVTDVVDPLTYFVCRHFVKTQYFALPNVLLSRSAVPEIYFTKRESKKLQNAQKVASLLQDALVHSGPSLAKDLRATFVSAKNPDELMAEFLREFFERDAH